MQVKPQHYKIRGKFCLSDDNSVICSHQTHNKKQITEDRLHMLPIENDEARVAN